MNRRRSPRQPRRVQVAFGRPGEPTRRGYTTDLSAHGMHISTQHPLPPRARLRIEVLHGERGFLVEGVVAHRRAVHPDLAKVQAPGMGVRFLLPEELIGELFAPMAAAGGGAAETAGGETGQPLTGLPGDPGNPRVFSVRFPSPEQFLEVYRRDIQNGGLFVATGRPGRLREVVNVEIFPPEPVSRPVVVQARVVQRFEPQPGSGVVLIGMGVELLDLPGALKLLQPALDQLEA